MHLGLGLGYWGATAGLDMSMVHEAERLGFDSVWAAESWGSDAVTVLSWVAAQTERIRVGAGILQLPARTPAMTAMTAVTLNELSGGRFLLGLGASGPQVAEGWHGVAYGKPLARTREYVSIVRTIVARKEPLEHTGDHYQIPYQGPDATGLGKPLKLITHPTADIPVYLAAIGPRNVALAAEIADGWLPVFYSPEKAGDVFGDALASGFARSGEENKSVTFEIAPSVQVVVDDDVDRARSRVKASLALYVGGMGAPGGNFYNDLACRYGYEAEAAEIQRLYLDGDRLAAARHVPDELVDEVAMTGSKEMIRDRLAVWRGSEVSTMILNVGDIATLRTIAELVG